MRQPLGVLFGAGYDHGEVKEQRQEKEGRDQEDCRGRVVNSDDVGERLQQPRRRRQGHHGEGRDQPQNGVLHPQVFFPHGVDDEVKDHHAESQADELDLFHRVSLLVEKSEVGKSTATLR